MLHFALFIALAAPATDVIAVHASRPSAVVQLKTALAAAGVVDGSSVHEYLLRPKDLLGMQDFEAFTARPIPGWPTSLEQSWAAVAQCRAVAGPVPWRDTLPSTTACARRISKYLWQQYIVASHADRVFVLETEEDAKKNQARVTGTTYQPGSVSQVEATVFCSPSELDETTKKVIQALLVETGKRTPREVVTALSDMAPGARR
jgi:hypothetical protein